MFNQMFNPQNGRLDQTSQDYKDFVKQGEHLEMGQNIELTPTDEFKPLEIAFEFNRGQLLQALKALGVVTVNCEYSGGGDSGGIDETYYKDAEGANVNVKLAEPVLTIAEQAGYRKIGTDCTDSYGRWSVLTKRGLSQSIDMFLYEVIEQKHEGDYVNNDGGSGTVNWDITNDTISGEGYSYYTESTCFSFEF